jgi:hypothetical protein
MIPVIMASGLKRPYKPANAALRYRKSALPSQSWMNISF